MRKENGKKIGIIVSLTMLFVTIVGVTYAAFLYTKKGTKENELTTGSISFVYNETSNGVTLTNAFPMTDEEGKTMSAKSENDNGYFDFNVTSTIGGDISIPYFVYAVDITGEVENKLSEDYVKIYLTDQEDKPLAGYDTEVPLYSDLNNINAQGVEGLEVQGKSLYQNTFIESGVHEYRLRIWVADTYKNSDKAETFKIRVDVSTDAEVVPKDQNKPTCEITDAQPKNANGNDDITMNIKCVDDNGVVTSNMIGDNIHVLINNEEVNPTKKELSEGISATEITGANGIQHSLTLAGFEKEGNLAIKIDSGVVVDQYKNTNDELVLNTDVKMDITPPVCSLVSVEPKEVEQDETLTMNIKCTDENGSISKDLESSDIKIHFSGIEGTATIEKTNTVDIDNGKSYEFTIKDFSSTGLLSVIIDENTITDLSDNGNIYTSLNAGEVKEKTIRILGLPVNNSSKTYANGDKTKMFEISQPDGSVGYRYIGNDPYNYVNLLGTDEGAKSENLWRVIGIFEEESAEGKKEQRIKLMKKTSIGEYSWDNKDDKGSNNWARPSALYTALNDAFYEAKVDGLCSKGAANNTVACDFSSYNLTSIHNKIEDMKWYLGSIGWSSSRSTDEYFKAERGNTLPSGASATTTGHVGLIYPSDYGYTYANGVSDKCYKTISNTSNCSTTEVRKGWMTNGSYYFDPYWTIMPYSGNTYQNYIIGSKGTVSSTNIVNNYATFPVIYLMAGLKAIDGSGMESDPYIIGEHEKDIIRPTCSISSVTPTEPTTKDQVKIKINCTDDFGKVESSLTKDDIVVKMNSETVELSTKDLSLPFEIEGGVEHTLTLSGFKTEGTLSIDIASGKVADEAGNTNIDTSITVGTIMCVNNTSNIKGLLVNSCDNYQTSTEKTKSNMYLFRHDTTDQLGANTDYRYIGDSPNNYINLLGTDDGKSDENLWRIIGVTEEENSSGIKEKRLKLIKYKSIGFTNFDSTDENVHYWARPSLLNTLLNDSYWNSANYNTYFDFSNNGLKSVQNKIENMKWYLGMQIVNVGTRYYPIWTGADGFYEAERSNLNVSDFFRWARQQGYTEESETPIPDDVPLSTTGHVGLAYVSDVGFVYGKGFAPTDCYEELNNNSCALFGKQNWITKGSYGWTMSSSINTGDLDSIYNERVLRPFHWNKLGIMLNVRDSSKDVFPVIYLKSSLNVIGGSGSKEDPYTVG